MPILIMALLALLIFGLIGILLTAATVVEHRKHAHVQDGTADVASSLKPKHP